MNVYDGEEHCIPSKDLWLSWLLEIKLKTGLSKIYNKLYLFYWSLKSIKTQSLSDHTY